jgi:hypothetical protein
MTRRVWDRKRPGESGTEKDEEKKTRRVWNRKRKDQVSLKPEEKRPGEFRAGRE